MNGRPAVYVDAMYGGLLVFLQIVLANMNDSDADADTDLETGRLEASVTYTAHCAEPIQHLRILLTGIRLSELPGRTNVSPSFPWRA